MEDFYTKEVDVEALPVPEQKLSGAEITTTPADENGLARESTLRGKLSSLITWDAWIGDYVCGTTRFSERNADVFSYVYRIINIYSYHQIHLRVK